MTTPRGETPQPLVCPPAFEGGVGGLGQGKRERGRRHEGKSASGSIFDIDRNRTSCYLVACQTTKKIPKPYPGQIGVKLRLTLRTGDNRGKRPILRKAARAVG